jgi:hypothetical protein
MSPPVLEYLIGFAVAKYIFPTYCVSCDIQKPSAPGERFYFIKKLGKFRNAPFRSQILKNKDIFTR